MFPYAPSIHDLLDIVSKPQKHTQRTCFLCLQKHNVTNNFSDLYNITLDKSRTQITVTLGDMVEKVFYGLDPLLLNNACEKCLQLTLTVYVQLIKRERAFAILENICNQISHVLDKNLNIEQRLNINLDKEQLFIINKAYEPQIDENNTHRELSKEVTSYNNCYQYEDLNKSKLTCNICNKRFKKHKSLKKHSKNHILINCVYCQKILKSHSQYKIHVKKHQSICIQKTKYYCNDCTYETSNKCTLEAHINKSHLHIRPYKCNICAKGFYKKGNMTEHTLSHNKEINNSCEVCGANFYNRQCLLKHILIHKEEKNFQCDVCKKVYVSLARKNEHVKRKHVEKDKECQYCSKKFFNNSELKRHEFNVHLKWSVKKDFTE